MCTVRGRGRTARDVRGPLPTSRGVLRGAVTARSPQQWIGPRGMPRGPCRARPPTTRAGPAPPSRAAPATLPTLPRGPCRARPVPAGAPGSGPSDPRAASRGDPSPRLVLNLICPFWARSRPFLSRPSERHPSPLPPRIVPNGPRAVLGYRYPSHGSGTSLSVSERLMPTGPSAGPWPPSATGPDRPAAPASRLTRTYDRIRTFVRGPFGPEHLFVVRSAYRTRVRRQGCAGRDGPSTALAPGFFGVFSGFASSRSPRNP